MERATRYALLICAAAFIPVPIVDTLAQNALRRRLVRGELTGMGQTATPGEVAALADQSVWEWKRLYMWPVRKVLGKILLPVQLASLASETLRLAEEARCLRSGGPGDPVEPDRRNVAEMV